MSRNPKVLAHRRLSGLTGRALADGGIEQGAASYEGLMFSRRTASGNAIPDAIIGHRLFALNEHASNVAAKAGDEVAAMHLAIDLVDAQMVKAVVDAAGSAPIFVPVISVEATGRNKIPLAVSEVLASKIGASTTTEIIQVNSPKRTAMDGLDRLLSPPEFDGEVIPGATYVLVDDTITQGGTFAALASHILDAGGKISAVVALTGKQYSAKIIPSADLLSNARDLYGDIESDFRAATRYGFDALTQSEVRYLAKHSDPESVRNRIIEAGRKAGQLPNEGNTGFAKNPLRVLRHLEFAAPNGMVYGTCLASPLGEAETLGQGASWCAEDQASISFHRATSWERAR